MVRELLSNKITLSLTFTNVAVRSCTLAFPMVTSRLRTAGHSLPGTVLSIVEVENVTDITEHTWRYTFGSSCPIIRYKVSVEYMTVNPGQLENKETKSLEVLDMCYCRGLLKNPCTAKIE